MYFKFHLKIGFFGVGFYSLFSICEEPFVVSGEECLGFHWKGDQLYTRRAPIITKEDKKGFSANGMTSVHLKLRQPIEQPNLDSLAQFLAKSLVFTASLSKIFVSRKIESECIPLFNFTKHQSPALPSDFAGWLSRNVGVFRLTGIARQSVQLDFEKMYTSEKVPEKSLLARVWRFATGPDHQAEQSRQPGKHTVFLNLVHGMVEGSYSSRFASEMERITKKKPSSKLRIGAIYQGHDELEAGTVNVNLHPILASISPFPASGHVYIGFETHQTTGLGMHLLAPFIPTVERESIDFSSASPTLKQWNENLTSICGRMLRVIYEEELDKLSATLLKASNKSQYLNQSIHIARAFGGEGFETSPSSLVGLLLRDGMAMKIVGKTSVGQSISGGLTSALFGHSPPVLRLPSSVGVVQIGEVRHVSSDLADLLVSVPRIDHLPQPFLQLFPEIPHTSIFELVAEMERRQFNSYESAASIRWLFAHSSLISTSLFEKITNHLCVPAGGDTSGAIENLQLPLASINAFFMPLSHGGSISLKIPPTCVSPSFYKTVPEIRRFVRLSELLLSELIAFNLSHATANGQRLSHDMAESILCYISDAGWPPIDQLERTAIIRLLSPISCIPTNQGLLLPNLAFTEECTASFEALPRLQFKNRSRVSNQLLYDLGVKHHLPVSELLVRFKQLNWGIRDLVKYLMRVQDDLSSAERELLAQAKLFPRAKTDQLSPICDLYINSPATAHLGLPILEWPDLNEHSSQGQFLASLGLRMHAPLEQILHAIPSSSPEVRTILFKYFLIDHYNNVYKKQYHPEKFKSIAFIPEDSGEQLYHPSECFSDDRAKLLGFPIAHHQLWSFADQLGIFKRPSTKYLCEKIILRSFDPESANKVFAFASSYNQGKIYVVSVEAICCRFFKERFGSALQFILYPNQEIRWNLGMVSAKKCLFLSWSKWII